MSWKEFDCQGICPKCGSHELFYEQLKCDGFDEVTQSYKCQKCGTEASELYIVEYSVTIILNDVEEVEEVEVA